MMSLLQKVLTPILYFLYFGLCLLLFGLMNLPYEEAEDLLERYALNHLNAELDIHESEISALGTMTIDRASLTFLPSIEEIKKIAEAERALAAWEDAQKKDTDNTDDDESEDESKAPEPESKGIEGTESDKGNVSPQENKNAALSPSKGAKAPSKKPLVPTAPLPINFEAIKTSVSPTKLFNDLRDGQLFNHRNKIEISGIVNGSKIALALERAQNDLSINFSVESLELGLLSVLSRLAEFPIKGALNVGTELLVPVNNDVYDFQETQGNLSISIQDEGKIGPATIKTKMGNVDIVPISFDKLELELQFAKRRVTINELRMSGNDLELCGTGYITLNKGRPKGRRPRRGKKNTQGPSAKSPNSKSTVSASANLTSMLQASRSNLFVRFKFKDKYLEQKENSLLRLLVSSRGMKNATDDEGFIGHKTTATLKSLAGPLSWVPSKFSPHKSSANNCGTARRDAKDDSKPNAKSNTKKRDQKASPTTNQKQRSTFTRGAKPYMPQSGNAKPPQTFSGNRSAVTVPASDEKKKEVEGDNGEGESEVDDQDEGGESEDEESRPSLETDRDENEGGAENAPRSDGDEGEDGE